MGRTDSGEYVPSAIELLLRRLDVWDAFLNDGHRRSCRSSVAWGTPFLASNDRLFRIDQTAWRLDRSRFDAMLQQAASTRVQVIDAEVTGVESCNRSLLLRLSNASTIETRFAIDATGRRAALLRMLGALVERFDRLVAVTSSTASNQDLRDLILESDELGWWYATDRADGSHLVVRMSDADLVHHSGLRNQAVFADQLASTNHVRIGEIAIGRPATFAASSQRVLLTANAPVLAAGDSAWTQDPVSGEGIIKALRSGFYAALHSRRLSNQTERWNSQPIRNLPGCRLARLSP